MRVYVETDRMILRTLTMADIDLLHELDSDPEVMRWLNGGVATPRDLIADEILPGFIAWYERAPGFGYWAALHQSSDEFLGWFGLHPVDDRPPDEAEIGYRLRRATWGQGYATEGVSALLRKGFEDLALVRVFGTTYQDNLASRRVMEKAGMRLTRRFRLSPAEVVASTTYSSDGEAWDGDDLEYAITHEEWTARHA